MTRGPCILVHVCAEIQFLNNLINVITRPSSQVLEDRTKHPTPDLNPRDIKHVSAFYIQQARGDYMEYGTYCVQDIKGIEKSVNYPEGLNGGGGPVLKHLWAGKVKVL